MLKVLSWYSNRLFRKFLIKTSFYCYKIAHYNKSKENLNQARFLLRVLPLLVHEDSLVSTQTCVIPRPLHGLTFGFAYSSRLIEADLCLINSNWAPEIRKFSNSNPRLHLNFKMRTFNVRSFNKTKLWNSFTPWLWIDVWWQASAICWCVCPNTIKTPMRGVAWVDVTSTEILKREWKPTRLNRLVGFFFGLYRWRR